MIRNKIPWTTKLVIFTLLSITVAWVYLGIGQGSTAFGYDDKELKESLALV